MRKRKSTDSEQKPREIEHANALFSAVRGNDLNRVKALIDAGAHPALAHFLIGSGFSDGRKKQRAIIYEDVVDEAVLTGNADILNCLVEAGGNVTYRALYIAVDMDRKDMVEYLVRHGAPVANEVPTNMSLYTREVLESPLSLAVRKRKRDLIQIMLESGQSIPMNASAKALERAIRDRRDAVIRLLLDKHLDYDPLNHILGFAFRTARADVISYMVQEVGVRPLSAYKRKCLFATSEDSSESEKQLASHGLLVSFEVNGHSTKFWDDDFKYMFEGGDLYRGGKDWFEKWHNLAELASNKERIQMLHALHDACVLDGKEFGYIYTLAILADDISIAEEIENMGYGIEDFTEAIENSMRDKKIKNIEDFGVPGMSPDKARFIIKRLKPGTKFRLGAAFLKDDKEVPLLLAILSYGPDSVSITDKKKSIMLFIKNNSVEGLNYLSEHGAFSERSMKEFIDYAIQLKNMDCQMWLMNYNAEHYQNSDTVRKPSFTL